MADLDHEFNSLSLGSEDQDPNEGGGEESIQDTTKGVAEIIPMSRDTCKLRHLIGAAPVYYGVPVSFKTANTHTDRDTEDEMVPYVDEF